MEGSRDNNFVQEAMNYYVAMKVLWNMDLDVDALMAEYYQFMFKSAAPEMKKFFDDLEELWIKKMRGQYIDTDLGPVSVKPTEYETWKQIYTPAKLKEWENLFKNAEKKAAKDKDTLTRIRFMQKNFLDVIPVVFGSAEVFLTMFDLPTACEVANDEIFSFIQLVFLCARGNAGDCNVDANADAVVCILTSCIAGLCSLTDFVNYPLASFLSQINEVMIGCHSNQFLSCSFVVLIIAWEY
jgi:hypothetical protein